jgi:predicted transcriptional regulator
MKGLFLIALLFSQFTFAAKERVFTCGYGEFRIPINYEKKDLDVISMSMEIKNFFGFKSWNHTLGFAVKGECDNCFTAIGDFDGFSLQIQTKEVNGSIYGDLDVVTSEGETSPKENFLCSMEIL